MAHAKSGCKGWVYVLGTIILLGSGSLGPASGARAQDAMDDGEGAVTALNAFGLQTLQALAPDPGTGTVVISPLSLSVALAMTAQGARSDTANAFLTLLGGGGVDPGDTASLGNEEKQAGALDHLATATQSLLATLERDATPNRFSTAQAVWVAADITLKRGFVDTLAQRFEARAEAVPFGEPSALAHINGWVNEKTDGLIPTLADRLSEDLAMVLANAIAFDGRWLDEFDPEQTQPQVFTLGDGTQRSVPTMHRQGARMAYAEDDRSQMVQLPYQGDLLALTVILPKQPLTARAWLQELTDAAALSEQLGLHRFMQHEGHLALPRLDVSYESELKAVLSALGLGIAFTPAADFSGMTDDRLRIDQVLHKVALKADEKGTKAAAVTGVLMTRTAAVITGPFEMIVDRPFLIALTHIPTGALLFFGVVDDPEQG